MSGKRYGTSLVSLIRIVTAPPTSIKGRSKIKRITEDDKYFAVYLKGCRHPLYYPKALGLDSLYLLINEVCCEYNDHFYELKETRVARGDVVADCGAAEGLFSLSVAEKCKKVYAIEPLPDFVTSMTRTFRPFNNIEVVPYALGDNAGMGYLSNKGISSSMTGNSNDIPVHIATIDDLFYSKGMPLSYIKADLEGYELKMLEGAKRTIVKNKPKIAITVYHNKGDGEEVMSYLKDLVPNYRFKIKGIDYNSGVNIMLHAWIGNS